MESKGDATESQGAGPSGHPTKLTEARIAGIAEKIATGSTIQMAFVLNGVSPRAGQYWLSMGRALAERGQAEGRPAETIESPWPRLPAPLLVKLLNAVEHAKAVDESNRVRAITAAGNGGATIFEKTVERYDDKTGERTTETVRKFAPPDWKAHAFLLERRDPNRWGRKHESRPAPP